MTDSLTVARSVVVQLVSRGGILLLSLVTTILLTRSLGPAAYGSMTVCLVVLQLLAPLADAGVSVTLATEGAAEPERLPTLVADARRIARRISIPLLVLGAVGVTAVSAGTGAARGIVIGAAIAALGLLANAHQAAVTGALQSRSRFGPDSLGDVVGKAGYLVGVITVVTLGGGAGFVLAVTVLPPVVRLAITRYAARDLINPSAPGATWRSNDLLQRAMPVGMSVLLFSVYFRLDTLVLAWLAGSADVGRYGADYRIAETLLVLPNFLTAALLPTLARVRRQDTPRAVRLSSESAGFLGGLGLGVAVAGPFLAEPMLTLLSGGAYASGSLALSLLLVSVGASFLTALWGTLLIVEGRARYLFRFSCVNVIANLAVNIGLIPVFGPPGAATATLFTELMALCIVGHRLVADGVLTLPWRTWGRCAAATIPLVLLLALTPHLQVVVRGCLAVAAYLMAAMGTGGLRLPPGLASRLRGSKPPVLEPVA